MSCAPGCQPNTNICASNSNLSDLIDLQYISDTILDVAQQVGFKIRFRQNLEDLYPIDLWCVANSVEEDTTTLRDGASTDKSSISLLIPRQPGLDFSDQLPIGSLIEKDYLTNIWHLVDNVVYSAGESSVSPSLVAYISFVEDDAQNSEFVPGNDHPTDKPEPATGTAKDPSIQYDPNNCACINQTPPNLCNNDVSSSQLVDLCQLSNDLNLVIGEIKYGPMRFRNNLLDTHPITINATITSNEQTKNGLRDYQTTGRNDCTILAPQQLLFPLYTLYGTKTSFTMPGALVEIQYCSNQWWMVDKVILSGRNPANSPVYTLFLSWFSQDPDGLSCLDVTNINPDFGPQEGGNEVVISGHNFTNNMQVSFNGVPGVITNINVVPDDLNGLCSLTVIVPPLVASTDVDTEVPLLIRNMNTGSSCLVYSSYVYLTETGWVDQNGIAWVNIDDVQWVG